MEADTEPDFAALRAELLVLRKIEDKTAAAIRNGQAAMKELRKGVGANHVSG